MGFRINTGPDSTHGPLVLLKNKEKENIAYCTLFNKKVRIDFFTNILLIHLA